MGVGEAMKVYFCYSKQAYDEGLLDTARQSIKNTYPPGTEVIESNDLDWKELVKMHGSQEVAYVEVVADHDEIVVLEHHGYLGKGLYAQLLYARELQKPSYVLRVRGNYLLLMEVKRVREYDTSNWKWKYGVVDVGEERKST